METVCLYCRPEDEPHPIITPDAYADNLLQVVEDVLALSGKQAA